MCFAFQAVLAAGSAGLQRGRLIIKTERGENRMAYIEAENLQKTFKVYERPKAQGSPFGR